MALDTAQHAELFARGFYKTTITLGTAHFESCCTVDDGVVRKPNAGHIRGFAQRVPANDHTATTSNTTGINTGVAKHAHAVAADHHSTAFFSRALARHIDTTAGHRIAAFGQQHHLTVFESQGFGLYQAFVVDHSVEQAVTTFGGEVDRTPIGLDKAFVFCQGVEGGLVDFDGEQRGVV